jgi:hypothetical protein
MYVFVSRARISTSKSSNLKDGTQGDTTIEQRWGHDFQKWN